jgi:putative ABC transport system permease protein
VTIERSQAAVSWQEVGADYQVEATNPAAPPSFDPRAIAGVEAAASALILPDALLSTTPGLRFRARLEAIHGPSWEAVVAGSPVDRRMPAWFNVEAFGPRVGTTDDPIPALMSTRLPSGMDSIAIGDVFQMSIRGRDIVFRLAELTDAFPGIGAGEPFVIVPIEAVLAAPGADAIEPNVHFVRGPGSLGAALLAAAGGPDAVTVGSRHAAFAAIHDAPLVAAVIGGFAIALFVAGAYAALAVVAVVVLHAQRRSREVAFLRTLGLTERQVAGLTLVEHGLPVVLALAIGVGLGLGLAWLLAPGIDLAAFSDPGAAVALQVDWTSVFGVAVAVVAVVSVAVGSSSWLARRLDIGQALRIGEQ